jgi:hypothetical protein
MVSYVLCSMWVSSHPVSCLFLQNPMVQQMIRDDPRFANDPTLQAFMQQFASNPAMSSQIAQMMRDPLMQREIQARMMSQGGGGGGVPLMAGLGHTGMGGGGSSTSQPRQGPIHQRQSASDDADEELTEEEMIAEAIRRSLQDG